MVKNGPKQLSVRLPRDLIRPREFFQQHSSLARDLVRLREIQFRLREVQVRLREIGRMPLKDEKSAFSAFLPFQATFHSKSFAPQI
ncbi:hypothetical protein QL285_029907 [Trifolium repens]|jgi:hypothetical protein|nr:hypothetical protein QL285_085337 [Trifolium repens]KAK2379596.1 hypothetical protein QL285_067379 [Trifolium repens]KAK2379598.1 hypothetical protein QL285_067381 [Trifolium repens]KAK2380224.1 hypothetical protein QL285_067939 [Trifolium repens]KAK2415500.1 hypothetical protein QL285_037974 [Trifolium repens]